MADAAPCGVVAAFLGVSHPVFDLGEQLLDRIEVGAIGRQEGQVRAAGSYGGPGCLAFVRPEIVEHHDIAWCKRWREKLLDIGCEEQAVDWPVYHARCVDPIMAQACDEGQRLPMAVRHLGAKPLPSRRPTSERRHVGLDPCLVDENEAPGADPALMRLPALALARDVRPILLGWDDRFF